MIKENQYSKTNKEKFSNNFEKKIYAKKSLGQNFLTSTRIVDAICNAGEVKKGDVVLEIGPGKGALTKKLIEYGAIVIAIEKDNRLISYLNDKFQNEIMNGQLQIINDDILETNKKLPIPNKYKLIANIPYYITGQIIRKFLEEENKPETIVLMVQKEVAERIIARDKKESILSISVKAFSEPELVMRVSKGNFFPIPKVDSAVIKMSNIKSPFDSKESEKKFFEIIKAGFGQKRKRLAGNLKNILQDSKYGEFKNKDNNFEKILEKLGLDKNIRAEDLSLKNWFDLSQEI